MTIDFCTVGIIGFLTVGNLGKRKEPIALTNPTSRDDAVMWSKTWKRAAKFYRSKYRARKRKVDNQRKEIDRLLKSTQGRKEHIHHLQVLVDELRAMAGDGDV